MAKTIIKYYPNGEVKTIKSSAGKTRHNKAAYELHRNNVQPTTTMKAIRFFRRLINYTRYKAELRRRSRRIKALYPVKRLEG